MVYEKKCQKKKRKKKERAHERNKTKKIFFKLKKECTKIFFEDYEHLNSNVQ